MDIPYDAFVLSMERDLLRSSSVFNPSPVSFIEPDDPFVEKVAEHILSKTEGFSDLQKAEAVLSFVQSSIAYTSDEKLYGTKEFWAFPVETLYLHRGDCEDTAILFCSISTAMDLESVLLDYDGHMAAGIREGGCYLFCETATDYLTPIGSSNIIRGGEEPAVCVPGDYSDSGLVLNQLVAGYRNLIQRLAGA